MVYEGCKIYGPYRSEKDNRYRIVVKNISDGTLTTISYPKYLIEKLLDRHLKDDEEVHHIDGDVTNNNLTNLILLNGRSHRHIHSRYDDTYWVCAYCDKVFAVTAKQVSDRTRNIRCGRVTRGPYCSRSCNGKDNH